MTTNPSADDDYNSASDGDFNPDESTAPLSDPSSPSSDEATTGPTLTKRSSSNQPDDGNLDFANSGDEATILSGQRKRKRKTHSHSKPKPAGKGKAKGKAGDESSDDETGGGGFVKTRAQRKVEGREKRAVVETGKASVDVDALWKEMLKPSKGAGDGANGGDGENDGGGANVGAGVSEPAAPSGNFNAAGAPNDVASTAAGNESDATSNTRHNAAIRPEAQHMGNTTESQPQPQPSSSGEADMVTIKRTYEFAGQSMTEERKVPKTSAEARLYLESQQKQQQQHQDTLSIGTQGQGDPKPPLRRPVKRKSMFGGVGPQADADGGAKDVKGPKLNTLQKSKLDWAAQVDKEGLGEELDEHGRAKGGYLDRMDFLSRMEHRREGR